MLTDNNQSSAVRPVTNHCWSAFVDVARFRIAGAQCLFADGEGLADILIEDGVVTAIDPHIHDDIPTINGRGCVLMPGMIDLHCDAIEKIIEMRPGVRSPLPLAIQQADRQFAAAGITTIYHSLSFATGELGLRSSDVALEIVEAIREYQVNGLIDNRLHCRYELGDPDSYPIIEEIICQQKSDLVSVMDHSPGQGQFKDREAYIRFVQKNYHCGRDEALARIAAKEAAADEIRERAEGVVRMAVAHGLRVASHDDDNPAVIAERASLGVQIAEFPITLAAGAAARAAGQDVLVGAPNIVRGGSQSGSLSAIEAIAQNSANCICSDYAPHTMLPAIWRIHRELDLPLWQAAVTATQAPAQAAALNDRGSIAVGQRADLLLVQEPIMSADAQVYPNIRGVWSAGRLVSSWGGSGSGGQRSS